MSRVHSVVGRSIMVHIYDVVHGDILFIRGDESDSIIERVERDGEKVRFHYKMPTNIGVPCSMWMSPETGAYCFINDLRNERAEFLEMVDQSCASS